MMYKSNKFSLHLLKNSLLTTCLLFICSATFAEERIALVIGISDYQYAPPLKNPEADAKLVSKTLEKRGFKTNLLINQGKDTILEGMEWFKQKLSEEAIGLIYFAGHGVQFQGSNYLVLGDTKIDAPEDLKSKAINTAVLFDTFKKAKSKVNIVILDACRNNPFADALSEDSRSLDSSNGDRGLKRREESGNGLTLIDAPINTLVAYATAPGQVALDGKGKNSPYSEALARAFNREALDIEQVFKEVRKEVYTETDGAQVPWENSSLIQSFYFNKRKTIIRLN
ncbi:caspase family protein [Spongiibacter sp. KMU-158]|uniref:Caspase family protein n=1 Tax=Spongiibacter pelagi TaxID=2760804 RepID=A0A927C281_9GAMM|nr:caspase family protein [Spongiibacter pelagi]MBD2858145.1 caspase family protein [Spongiibacter pelagi]